MPIPPRPLTGAVTSDSAGFTTIQTSIALPGSPTTTTQAAGDNSTKIATDAFVTTAIANAIAGVNPAVAVQAATTLASNTSTYTYNNGVSGVGATLTGVANTALTVDGYTFTALGQRLLVKNDTQSPSGAFNGVYYVTQVQTALLPVILTRALDYNSPSDINNTGAIPVVNGTVNGTTSWLLTSSVTTVGTDPLTYTQFSLNPNATQTANTVHAGPSSGAAAVPTWRALVNADVGIYWLRVQLHANVTISNSDFSTNLTWSASDILQDDLTAWAAGSPTIFTTPTGVNYYRITVQTFWASNSAGGRWVFVKDNGTQVLEDTRNALTESAAAFCSQWLPATVGNPITFLFSQTSGGNLVLTGTTGFPSIATRVMIEWKK